MGSLFCASRTWLFWGIVVHISTSSCPVADLSTDEGVNSGTGEVAGGYGMYYL